MVFFILCFVWSRIVAIMDDKKGLIIQNVGGKHNNQRYILSNILYDGTLHKFQALAAWKDRHAKFVKVYNPRLGLVFLVRPSSLHGGHPKVIDFAIFSLMVDISQNRSTCRVTTLTAGSTTTITDSATLSMSLCC